MKYMFQRHGTPLAGGRLGIEATVLLSMRSELLRAQVRSFLEDLGLTVVEAGSPSDTSSSVDLLLTDRASGSELAATQAVLRRCPDVTVLAISGDPQYATRAVSQQVRISFIEKPFAWCELERKIADLLLARLRARATGFPVSDPTNIVVVSGLSAAAGRC